MRAEVGPDGRAGDVLAEPDGQRARGRRHVAVDVAEGDEVRAEVRHLDSHRLLAGNRREDADLGRGERVAQVVLQLRDLGHLRAGGELQLVAGDARPGDLADDRGVDAEVREAGDKGVGDALAGLASDPCPASRRAGANGRAACSRRPAPASRRASPGDLGLVFVELVARRGRGRGGPRTETRSGKSGAMSTGGDARARALEVRSLEVEEAASRPAPGDGRAHGGMRAPQNRPERHAGQEEHAGNGEQHADDRRAGGAEPERDDPFGPRPTSPPCP